MTAKKPNPVLTSPKPEPPPPPPSRQPIKPQSDPFAKASDEELPWEVCIKRENGEEVWLVPRRRGVHDIEILPADLRMLWAIQQTFPGSTLESFVSLKPGAKEEKQPQPDGE